MCWNSKLINKCINKSNIAAPWQSQNLYIFYVKLKGIKKNFSAVTKAV